MTIDEAVKSIDTLVGSLKSLKSTLNDTINSPNNNKLKENVDSSVKTIETLKKAMNFGVIYAGLRKGWNIAKGISSDYIDMIETNNLFEVSMGKVVDEYGNLDEAQSQYYTKAIAFQNEMNEKLGTNKKELKEYQAMYYSMLNSQGINKDKSYLMSESLTKAGYDIASLYNLSVEDAMDKLKSGLAGQVEPLRKIGVDISESSLQKVLNEVGIDRKVQQLSYAEKEVARYIAIMEQAGQAQGDFARTFESPANQVRVFKNQLIELRQVAGAFIVNTFGNILTYANAIIMVLKEIMKSFANLFGYDLDTGGADLSTATGIDGLNDGLGSATKKAKELKKQLMGFDEINNIDPNSQTSGSGNGGGTTGIDSKLLDALTEWDNKMSSISGKAQEIRDKMLEWLGFVRNDDGTWKLKEGLTNFEKILDVVKTIGIAISTWKVASTITKLMENLGMLNKSQAFQVAFGLTLAITGIYASYKGISHLMNGDVDLFTILETVLGTASGTLGIVSILQATKIGKSMPMKNKLQLALGIMIAIDSLIASYKGVQKVISGNATLGDIIALASSTATGGLGIAMIVKQASQMLGKTISFKQSVVIGLSLMFAVEGLQSLYTISKEIEEGSKSLNDSLGQITLSASTTIGSLALLGTQIGGPWGALIGAGAGTVASLGSAILGTKFATTKYHDEVVATTSKVKDLVKEVEDSTTAYKNNKKAINDTLEDKLADLGVTETLIKELGRYVDANGKVVQGNEKRVDYILGELSDALGVELKRDGELITNNGKVVTSYQALQKELTNTIDQLKKEAEAEAYQELYKEAIKQKIKDQNALQKAIEARTEAIKEFDKLEQAGTSKFNKEFKQVAQNVVDTCKAVDDLTETVENDTKDISNYSSELSKNVVNSTNKMSLEMVKKGEILESQMQNIVRTNWSNWESIYNQADTTTKQSMLTQSTTVDTWSPKLQQKWADMAKNSLLNFNNAFNSLSADTKNLILGSITTTENLTGNVALAWYDLAKTSKDKYEQELSKVDDTTRQSILDAVKQINNLSPSEQENMRMLAKKSTDSYDKEISNMKTYTENKIKATASILNRDTSISNSMGALSARSSNAFNVNGYSLGSNVSSGIAKGISAGSGSVNIAISNIASNITSKVKSVLGIHSPSRVMADLSKYIPLGMAEGIDSKADSVYASMEKINEGIKVNTKDFVVDTNQYVDYGMISGQIQAQSNVALNSNMVNRIAEASYNAFCKAMRDEGVKVDVVAKTDEGVIFKKVQSQAENYAMQTGENPFPVLA